MYGSKWHTQTHAGCENWVKLTDHVLVLFNNDQLHISDEADKIFPFINTCCRCSCCWRHGRCRRSRWHSRCWSECCWLWCSSCTSCCCSCCWCRGRCRRSRLRNRCWSRSCRSQCCLRWCGRRTCCRLNCCSWSYNDNYDRPESNCNKYYNHNYPCWLAPCRRRKAVFFGKASYLVICNQDKISSDIVLKIVFNDRKRAIFLK